LVTIHGVGLSLSLNQFLCILNYQLPLLKNLKLKCSNNWIKKLFFQD
jgi:hypothetical protein